jgi:purine-binding chemotaxis protein CheW
MSPALHGAAAHANAPPPVPETVKLVTVSIAAQRIGIPIDKVRDVFMAPVIATVPLAPPHVAGLVNLRGKIVTVLALRAMMGYPPQPDARTVIGLEWQGESYGLLVDRVGGVIDVPDDDLEKNPPNLDARWSGLSAGIRRLEDGLLLQLDTIKLFPPSGPALS